MTYAAFFDLDETIINAKSMIEVVKYYFSKVYLNQSIAIQQFKKFEDSLRAFERQTPGDRQALNQFFYKQFEGLSVSAMVDSCKEWFSKYGQYLFNTKTIDEIRYHQHNKHEVAIVSGSFKECVAPIAAYLGINHCLCAELEVIDGRFSGNLINGPVIGSGKAQKLEEFANKKKIDLNHCFAYGDHISDLPMFELVGHPIVVGGDFELREYAVKHDWKSI